MLRFAAGLGLAVLVSGCATALVSEARKMAAISPKARANEPIYQDAVLAVVRPDEATRDKSKNGHALVFVGEQYSYLILEGGDGLLEVRQRFGAGNVRLEPGRFFVKDEDIWGEVALHVAATQEKPLTDSELAALRRQGFAGDELNGMVRNFHVRGLRTKRSGIPADATRAPDVRREPVLRFYPPPDSAAAGVGGYDALIPLALLVDVLTLPIQLLGFIVLLIVPGGNLP